MLWLSKNEDLKDSTTVSKNKQIIDLCGVGLIGSIKNKQTHTQ